MDLKSTIFYIIVIAATIVGLGLINSLSKYLISKVNTIIGNIEVDSYNNCKELICWIRDVFVRDVVISLNETVVKEVKKAAEDGKITAEEGKMIFQTAVDSLKKQLSEDIQKKISLVVGDIDSWIKSVVESVLKEEKMFDINRESNKSDEIYPTSITSTTYFANNNSSGLDDYSDERF